MKLAALFTGAGVATAGPADVEVTRVVADSRCVRPGDLFVALTGSRADGHHYVAEAVARGARAVVVERGVAVPAGVAVVRVRNARRLLGELAARAVGEPSRALTLVGVTGTNGKTTVTYLLEAIWRAEGRQPGIIGTLGGRWDGQERPPSLTTPEAPELQALLAEMLACGVRDVAVEVSSHALELERVRGCQWDCAVFTNLGRDHLDFHRDTASYYRAKARLFLEHLPASTKADPCAVIGAGSPWGQRLAAEVRVRKLTFGRDPGAAVHPLAVSTDLGGTRATVATPAGSVTLESPLVGWPHVDNLLAAVAVGVAQGLPLDAIAAGVRACRGPRGRIECFPGPGFSVVVDYAHTPDALEAVLATLRALGPRRLLAVFGCGGDRDRGKRPLMGQVAARLSSLVVLTSDNPRSEDPLRILAEVEAGVVEEGLAPVPAAALGEATRGYCVEPDRREAIALAVGAARPGDIVLVAGKGHENYQLVGARRHHLDDREEVLGQIAAARGAGGAAREGAGSGGR